MFSLLLSRTIVITMSIITVMALSACQPATQETTLPEDIVTVETNEIEVDTEIDVQDTASENMIVDNNTQVTDILKDYTKSMTSMHDEMVIGTNYNDPDVAFAKSMLGHHRGTIDMANVELKYGTDASMRQLAQDIIVAQQVEIDTMRKWLASNLDAPDLKPNTQAMQQAYTSSMDKMHSEMMLGITDPIPDVAFARTLLPHHTSAIDMAKIQLRYGKDEEMRRLAQEITNNQPPKIEQMQDWIVVHSSSKTPITDGLATAENTDNSKATTPTT